MPNRDFIDVPSKPEGQDRESVLWRDATAAADAAARAMIPDMTVMSGAAMPDAVPLRTRGRRPLARGNFLHGMIDRAIAACSLVSTDSVLDVRDFAWTEALRANWRAIRDEALAVALDSGAPALAAISPDHRAVAQAGKWRSFFLWGHGYVVQDHLDRCPRTASLIASIPGLNSAFLSILAPGTHIQPHRGVTKGLITCHLGLIIPRDGDCRLRLGERVLRWAEGETLVFDDSCEHEVWNDSSGTRIVLLIQFRRPLRNPGRWIADRVLAGLRRRAFA